MSVAEAMVQMKGKWQTNGKMDKIYKFLKGNRGAMTSLRAYISYIHCLIGAEKSVCEGERAKRTSGSGWDGNGSMEIAGARKINDMLTNKSDKFECSDSQCIATTFYVLCSLFPLKFSDFWFVFTVYVRRIYVNVYPVPVYAYVRANECVCVGVYVPLAGEKQRLSSQPNLVAVAHRVSFLCLILSVLLFVFGGLLVFYVSCETS